MLQTITEDVPISMSRRHVANDSTSEELSWGGYSQVYNININTPHRVRTLALTFWMEFFTDHRQLRAKGYVRSLEVGLNNQIAGHQSLPHHLLAAYFK